MGASVTVYTSWEDAVEEGYDPELDGDDGVDPKDRTSLRARVPPPPEFVMQRRGLLKPAATIVVPYPPGVNEGDSSDAVYAIKRAFFRKKGGGHLRQLERKPLPVRREWQKTFSQEFGGKSYTMARHQKLAPWFDDYALKLLRANKAEVARDRMIAAQLGWHNALYNRRFQVPYSQERPSQLVSAQRVTRADCSGSVAGGCAWAGVMKTVDWRYTNTWAQIKFGASVGSGTGSIRDAIAGDVILYGSPSHEALYLGNGLVWSFGSYPCKILPHDYRHDRCAIRRFVPVPSA